MCQKSVSKVASPMTRRAVLRRIDTLVWVFVFGGLLTLVLGLSAERLDAFWGWLLVAAGALATVLGFVLWIVRARLPEDSGDSPRS